ncbi:MAG: hypothetical protein AAGD13_09220 [Pseudomonadota bacterium]
MRDGARSMAQWTPLVVAMLAVMVAEPLYLFSGHDAAQWIAHVAMGAVLLTSWRLFGAREWYLLALCAVLAGLIWRYAPDASGVTQTALDQAAFLMAFLFLISLVQEGAMTSRSVEQVGSYLAQQPGGRRYTGLYIGTNLMAVVFNLGTMSLLAPLIRRAELAGTGNPLTPVRARRQYCAVLRGFAWSVVWSPTAISPLVLLTLIDGIERWRWIALGLLLSAIMLLVGWAEDRWRWRHMSAAALGLPPQVPPPFPTEGVKRFAVVCVTLAGLTGLIMTASGRGVPASLIVACPLVLIGWLIVQAKRDPGRVEVNVGRRLTAIAQVGLPQSATAAVVLACAGFVGQAGAALLPAREIADRIGLDDLPAWVFMLSTTLGVTLLSQFALSPVMMSVFFGAVLGSLPSLPADPTLTALAVATGWALSTTFSPFASGVIFLSRVSGHGGAKLTYNWNGPFSALSVIVLAGAYWVMTGGS